LHVHEHGYTEVSPPFIISRECMTAWGQFPKFEDQAYAVREGNDDETLGKLYLLPDGGSARRRTFIAKKSFRRNNYRFGTWLIAHVFGLRRARREWERAG
jgi:seryl-tRNA synthetase